jgi:hypothetical protein
VTGLEQVLQSPKLETFCNMFLLGSGLEGFLLMTNWRTCSSLCGAEWGCAITVQRFGTATLFKCVLSANVKTVPEKCWLHTYCVHSLLVCSALQGFHSLSAYSRALCHNNEITNYRNETVFHMVSVFCCIITATFCCIGYTTCWSNTQNYFWMQHKADDERSDMNTFFKLRQ